MANRPSRIVISIQTASYDGKFYGRYAHGEKPVSGAVLAGDAAVLSAVSAALSTGIRLAGGAQATSQETAGLSTAIRLSGSASDVVAGAAAFSDDDWTARSAGAFFANRLDTQAAIDTYGFQDGFQPRLPVLDVSLKPSGAAGSAKIVIANTDGSSAGALKIPFGRTFTAGQTFWSSYRLRVPPECAYMHWPTADETGLKSSIISNTQQSNMNHELVVQDTDMGARVQGYYQDGNNTAVHTNRAISTSANASDFTQPADIDRSVRANSAAFTTYPLSGTNPDTGAAWSTWEQERARFGLLYSALGSPGAPDYKRGLGDPISGAARLWPGEFITITQRMIVGQYGQANNRWTCWAARDGQPYVLCWDLKNILLGSDGLTNPYNCLWLPTGYVSNRQAGGRNISSRSSNITGVTIHAAGNATPIGAGTLEYNATTQRFRWSGFGESFGTARGFSTASGKTRLNVISNNVNSWLVIEVTPASLPSSSTVTDSVTIADGRPDTQVNLGDVIFHTQAINAPRGFPPVDIDGTALQQAIAGLSANAFGTLTMSAVPNIGVPANTIMEFVSNWWRNPNTRTIDLFGIAHTSGVAGFTRYQEVSNNWTSVDNTRPDGASDPNHAYACTALDPTSGDFYWAHGNYNSGSLNIYRRAYATGLWTLHSTYSTSGWAQLVWHPGLNGGTGGLLMFNDFVIAAYYSGSWHTLLSDGAGQLMTSSAGATAYNYKDGCAYGGNTTGSNPGLYKVTAAGVVTKISNPTIPVGVQSNGSNNAMLCASGNAANRLLAIRQDGAIHEYNETNDTWAVRPETLPNALLTAESFQWVASALPDLGAIAFVYQQSGGTMSPTMIVWKH